MLSALLERICALQKAYGKTQAELETLVEGFSWALAGHSLADIQRAFRRYIVSHSDIPAPADILKLIKEVKGDDAVVAPSLDMLRQYRAKGIPLTPRQEEALRQAGRETA